MAEKVYAVTFHVTEKNLGTILTTLLDAATLVSVVPTQESARVNNVPASPSKFYVKGLRNKGISGEELLMRTLSSERRVFSSMEIFTVFTGHNFAGNSAGPVLSKLVKSGKVRALGGGKFCLPELISSDAQTIIR